MTETASRIQLFPVPDTDPRGFAGERAYIRDQPPPELSVELSVVVPVYDEEESLPVLHDEVTAVLRGLGRPWEVIYVDDGSADRTPEVLAALAAEEPRVRILSMGSNCGQSAAMAAGWLAARGEVVATLDADLQNDPADIPHLLARLEEGWDVVSGVRAKRRDSWTRRWASRIANGVRNRLTGSAVTDVGCTLRLYRRRFLVDLPRFDGMHRFLPTLLALAGARITEMPVHHRPRRYGQAKYGIGDRLWRGLRDLFAVRWLQQRWIEPARAVEVTPERAASRPREVVFAAGALSPGG